MFCLFNSCAFLFLLKQQPWYRIQRREIQIGQRFAHVCSFFAPGDGMVKWAKGVRKKRLFSRWSLTLANIGGQTIFTSGAFCFLSHRKPDIQYTRIRTNGVVALKLMGSTGFMWVISLTVTHCEWWCSKIKIASKIWLSVCHNSREWHTRCFFQLDSIISYLKEFQLVSIQILDALKQALDSGNVEIALSGMCLFIH